LYVIFNERYSHYQEWPSESIKFSRYQLINDFIVKSATFAEGAGAGRSQLGRRTSSGNWDLNGSWPLDFAPTTLRERFARPRVLNALDLHFSESGLSGQE
jgi:hypothetical protein